MGCRKNEHWFLFPTIEELLFQTSLFFFFEKYYNSLTQMIVLKINKAGPQIHTFREIGMNVWQSPLLGG